MKVSQLWNLCAHKSTLSFGNPGALWYLQMATVPGSSALKKTVSERNMEVAISKNSSFQAVSGIESLTENKYVDE